MLSEQPSGDPKKLVAHVVVEWDAKYDDIYYLKIHDILPLSAVFLLLFRIT